VPTLARLPYETVEFVSGSATQRSESVRPAGSIPIPSPQVRGISTMKGRTMMKRLISFLAFASIALAVSPAWADKYQDTINVFKKAVESSKFFDTAYGYAVFPTIGKGGAGIGGAFGKGQVYEQGKHVGDTSMTQVTVGLQLGGQGYSQIIFFEDQRAFQEFTSGNFEFGAEASAVAITAGAGAKTGTTGTSVGASAGKHDAKVVGAYHKGMATFTVAKGGLMYEASVGGQKFSYKKR
jgi:lipid-binding SYLF domain-containing protein